LRLNLGCGSNRLEGFVNVDFFAGCQPDRVVDLETFPWPFADNAAEVIVLHHVLEHLGQQTAVFLQVMKELYRVSRNGCVLHITVPHPNHADFSTDPSHVRSIKPETLGMFSQDACEFFRSMGYANTPFADICEVDFTLQSIRYDVDATTLANLAKVGIVIAEQDAHLYAEIFGSLIKQIAMELIVTKPATTELPSSNQMPSNQMPSNQPTPDPSLPS